MACRVAELIDLLLHVDRYLLELVATYGGWIYAILFLDRLCGNRSGRHAVSARGFAALRGREPLRRRGAGRPPPRRAAARRGDRGRRGELLDWPVRRAAHHPSGADGSTWGAGSIRLCRARARILRTARGQGRSCSAGSCRSCARSCRSWPGWRRCPIASFALYNVTGGIAWVAICLGAGYVFGNVPIVKDNFSLVALGIVLVSLLPMVFEYLRYRRASSSPPLVPRNSYSTLLTCWGGPKVGPIWPPTWHLPHPPDVGVRATGCRGPGIRAPRTGAARAPAPRARPAGRGSF